MTTYVFDHWEVNGVTDTSIPLNITITADTTIMVLYHEKGVTPPVVQAGIPIWIIPVALIGIGVIYIMSKKK